MKRSTIYLDDEIHRALKLRSAETDVSVSEFVNDAVREALSEDLDDLETFERRAAEPAIDFESFLRQLRRDGKV